MERERVEFEERERNVRKERGRGSEFIQNLSPNNCVVK